MTRRSNPIGRPPSSILSSRFDGVTAATNAAQVWEVAIVTLPRPYVSTTTAGANPNFFARRANLRSSNDATVAQGL